MNISNQPCPARVAPSRNPFSKLSAVCSLLAVAWLISVCPVPAQEQDNKYLRIHNLIQQADSLNSSGQTAQALLKYREAAIGLQNFRTTYPGWNVKAVEFRSKYLAEKVASLSKKLVEASETNAPATSAPPQSAEKKVSPPAATPQVKLLEPGAEPRKALRLHAKAGDKQTLTITTKMGMEIKMGENENQPVKMPSTTIPMDLTVKSIGADGAIIYDLVLGETTIAEEPGVMPQVTEAIKASFNRVKGHTAQGKMSSRGFNKVEIKFPAGANPQTRQSLEQMKDMLSNSSVPFPEEPVGLGSKWEAKMQIKSQGLTTDQTALYELAALEGEQATIKTTIKQNAANQKVPSPAMPGMKVDLTKMTATGTAVVKLDLARTLPSDVTATLHSESTMVMNMGAEKQAMAMKMDINVRMESK